MRYLSLIILMCVALACKQNAKGDKTDTAIKLDTVYTINGIVEGAEDNEMVVLQFLGTTNSDTTYTKKNSFEFKGRATEQFMALAYLPNSLSEQSKPLSFMVENATINIEGNIDSLHQALVVGGLANNDYNVLKKIFKIYDDRVRDLTNEAKKAQSASDISVLQNLQVQYNQTMVERQEAIKQFAIENPASIAGAYFVYQDLSSNYDINSLDTIYQALDPSIKNSIYVKKIKTLLDVAKQTAIGKPAPDFTLNDVSGRPVSLSSLKGKYVLVDFWASWCGPCRQENPNVVNAYKQYKNKDFTVLGVSLDEDKAAWKQAIQKDGLTWAHVSDLKGWQSSAATQYGIQAIPANFLLDKEGIIIARDLREAALTEKLEEILTR